MVKEVTPKLETFNKSEALDALKKEAHRELEAPRLSSNLYIK